MAINPFDILKNIKNIQSRMGEVQEKLQDISVTGSGGGDMVKIEINGKMEILNVKISPEAVDKDDIEILEDLIRAAFNDAMIKLKQKMREEFSFLSNNMNIPPGLMGM